MGMFADADLRLDKVESVQQQKSESEEELDEHAFALIDMSQLDKKPYLGIWR
jgi:hypothetical protein